MAENILVVIPDRDKCRILQLTFRDEGYLVDTAFTTESAVELGQKNNYYAVFLDVQDNNIDSEKVCHVIKDHNPKTRVIAMTSFETVYSSEECKSAGYDSYFPMPYDTRDLIRVVRNAIAGKAIF